MDTPITIRDSGPGLTHRAHAPAGSRPAPARHAAQLGRRHGKAAVYWQIGDNRAGQAWYRDLLRGIEDADPAILGVYQVPDLSVGWDYTRDDLARDLGVTPGDENMSQAADAYLAAAAREFWDEAGRLARRHLRPGGEL